ncbi:hypothetical protein AB205_0099640 [Aquarana catesbeiana]|uniref:Uncharacterized protein n=1 Tax=Aquarana catesbeiana TaxID=8400 RepID=A0A2G9Q2S7_AQUCT|nr:hypothetical protein AB205_0099640 [Aquarana catesbeiana]
MKELKLLGVEEDFTDLKHAPIDFNVKKSESMKELKLLGAEEDFKDFKHAPIDFNVKKKVLKSLTF